MRLQYCETHHHTVRLRYLLLPNHGPTTLSRDAFQRSASPVFEIAETHRVVVRLRYFTGSALGRPENIGDAFIFCASRVPQLLEAHRMVVRLGYIVEAHMINMRLHYDISYKVFPSSDFYCKLIVCCRS